MTKTVFQKGSLNPENYINKPIHEKCCSFVINLERRTDRLKQFENRYMPNDFIDLYIKKNQLVLKNVRKYQIPDAHHTQEKCIRIVFYLIKIDVS